MSVLTDLIYRTNKPISTALKELNIHPSTEELKELLGELECCTHCGIYYWSHELIPDLDDNQICRFCSNYYGL